MPIDLNADVANVNRTKGGAGGPTTTVSTLPQLSAAAAAPGPLIIVVQGTISGAAKISVTSNKSIIGKTGSCECTPDIDFPFDHSLLNCTYVSCQLCPALV